MNEYIFYTTEGHTIAPNENVEVENCQVIGCACGNNQHEAMKQLIEENPWFISAGYDTAKLIARQLAQ